MIRENLSTLDRRMEAVTANAQTVIAFLQSHGVEVQHPMLAESFAMEHFTGWPGVFYCKVLRAYMCMHTHSLTLAHIHIHVGTHTNTRWHTYNSNRRSNTPPYIYIYMDIHIHIHIYIYVHVHLHVYIKRTGAHAHTHRRTYTHVPNFRGFLTVRFLHIVLYIGRTRV